MKQFEFQLWFYWSSLSNRWIVSIGSDSGLVPNSLQAITWSNDNQVVWDHMASIGHNELKGLSEMWSKFAENALKTL